MREIKFRFWSNHLKKFVAPDDAIFVGALKDPDMNPMQFTGLHDKNGAEIYEGDIVERQGGKRGKIIFYAGGFFWEQKDTELTPLAEFGWEDVSIYMVIGNIYESPELCGW